MENWQVNISLIPGIALILGSANRMALGLTDEINSRLSANETAYHDVLPSKIAQLRRLSLAIVLFYLSLGLLVINALLAALAVGQPFLDRVLMLLSIIFFLGGIGMKMLFSLHAYNIRQRQFKKFLENGPIRRPNT